MPGAPALEPCHRAHAADLPCRIEFQLAVGDERLAIERAKLDPPSRGAHLLRYSLATNLLRRGGSLPEVSELLRHRHPDTTALYAKVDLEALRSVAQVWPGARR